MAKKKEQSKKKKKKIENCTNKNGLKSIFN